MKHIMTVSIVTTLTLEHILTVKDKGMVHTVYGFTTSRLLERRALVLHCHMLQLILALLLFLFSFAFCKNGAVISVYKATVSWVICAFILLLKSSSKAVGSNQITQKQLIPSREK